MARERLASETSISVTGLCRVDLDFWLEAQWPAPSSGPAPLGKPRNLGCCGLANCLLDYRIRSKRKVNN